MEPTTTVAAPVTEAPIAVPKGTDLRAEAPGAVSSRVGGPQSEKNPEVPMIEPSASTSPSKSIPAYPAAPEPTRTAPE